MKDSQKKGLLLITEGEFSVTEDSMRVDGGENIRIRSKDDSFTKIKWALRNGYIKGHIAYQDNTQIRRGPNGWVLPPQPEQSSQSGACQDQTTEAPTVQQPYHSSVSLLGCQKSSFRVYLEKMLLRCKHLLSRW